MAIPYTVRKPSGTFHFRWRIPSDYQHLGNELRLSLSTSDKHQARAKAAALRLEVETLIHDVASLDDLRQRIAPERPQRRTRQRHPSKRATTSPTLTALWDKYAAHQLADAREKTRHESRHALGVMVELVGDLPPYAFDKPAARDFVERLADYPTRRSLGRFASMTLEEIQAGDYQRISPRTQRNTVALVSTFATWLVNFGYLPANPLEGIKPKRTSAGSKRKTWTRGELAQWFGSETHQKADGWKYWLPLLGIYTGARLEELAALAPDDIRHHQGIDYIDIHGRDGRHIKNAGSWRAVPIHSRLIELGFLDYAASRKGQERLFDVSAWKGRYGFRPSKWFTYHRQKLGISPDFHGFRHTVAEELRLCGGQGHAISWLLGHAAQTMTDHYGSDGDKRERLPMLAELVERLDWHGELSSGAD